MTALEKWKNDFKEFISELSIPRDDYKGIMEYINEVPNEALEQKLCEDVVKKDCGNCAYYDNGANDEACNGCFEDEEHLNFKPKAQPCEDCISREEAINCVTSNEFRYKIVEDIKTLPSVTPKEKIGYCKDCKWWKDNDGVYRRGIGAESKCPINCKKVYEGNGYCFMFEPQESEVQK